MELENSNQPDLNNSTTHSPGETYHPGPVAPPTPEQPSASPQPEPAQPAVPKAKSSFGKSLAKTLLWIVLLVLIGIVGALVAIYVFKI